MGFFLFKKQIIIFFPGSNILLARMATRKAKPDGQYHLKPEEVDDFIREQLVTMLPGNYYFVFLWNIYVMVFSLNCHLVSIIFFKCY